MEDVAMLRDIIAHFHHLSSPSPFCVSSSSIHHPSSASRWYFLNGDESSMEDEHSIRDGKTWNCKMKEHHEYAEAKKPRKQYRAKAPTRVSSSEVMDGEIWKEFPEDLLEAVIARLPISSFFQLRSVCRKWNSFLESHSFSQHCAQVPRNQPWIYTVTNGNVSIYDSFMKKWRHPNTASFAPKMTLLPAAFAGGLVCLHDPSQTYFYVCNPLTQTWKELPARSVKAWSRVVVGMTLNGDSPVDGYKIIRVSDYEFECYDSLTNTWTCQRKIPSNINLPLTPNSWSQAVSDNTMVYFLRLNPEGIVTFDMDSGMWKQYLIPIPPNSRDVRLAQCGPRIMLVGLLTKNAATCVCVWELQKMTLLWKEVDRMPNVWCLDFYSKYVLMMCLGNQGLLMMVLDTGHQMDQVVTYDVMSRKWSKVRASPHGRKIGIAFYPCLAASP